MIPLLLVGAAYLIGKTIKKDESEMYSLGGSLFSRSRLFIPDVRGGWNKNKILKYLKSHSTESGYTYAISKVISSFDSVDDFADHIYYHGTANYIEKGLKPSITLTERQAEQMGGGGYGNRYWGISLTKRKKTAESFSGMSSSVTIYPVILKKDAKVIIRENLKDAAEIEDIIVDLYESGVDAVWIGGGEEELVLINPYAAIIYKNGSESHAVYGGFKSKQLTKEQIQDLYNKGKEIYAENTEKLKYASLDERKKILSSIDKLVFEEGGEIDYSNYRTSVIGLFNKGKILILQRGSTANWMPNKWSIVGGVVDEGENPKEAIIRECFEEVGLKPKNVFFDYNIMTDDSGKIYYYHGNLESDKVKLDYENSNYAFISKSEIDNYDFVPHVKDFIIKLFSKG